MLQIDTWKRVLIWLVCVTGLILALPNAFYTRVEQSNDAKAAIELGANTPENQAQAANNGPTGCRRPWSIWAWICVAVRICWPRLRSRMSTNPGWRRMWPEIRDALRDERATVGTIRRQDSAPDQIRVRISQPEGMPRALEVVRGLARQVQTLTGVGGNRHRSLRRGRYDCRARCPRPKNWPQTTARCASRLRSSAAGLTRSERANPPSSARGLGPYPDPGTRHRQRR